MRTRRLQREDFDQIVQVVDSWWGGTAGERALPIFFHEFGHHGLVAVEDDGTLLGFLFGFVTDADPRTGYIHMLGIAPEQRRRGVARMLYEDFGRHAADVGAVRLKAINTSGNQGSVGFHRALGFDCVEDPDYGGPGRARNVFTRVVVPLR